MKLHTLLPSISVGFACLLLSGAPDLRVAASAAEGLTGQKATGEQARGAVADQPLSASRAAREEKAIQDARRQQLAEKEAALAAKEEELKKLGAKLDTQIRSLGDSKKRLDDSLKAQKKAQDEKQKKMIGLFKKMRPEQAGLLIDKLEEEKVIALLNQMDTKTVIKLIPYLKQPRVLKWVTENLRGI